MAGGRHKLRTPKEVAVLAHALDERGLLEPMRAICRMYHVTLDDVLIGHGQTMVVRARDCCAHMLLEDKGFSSNEGGKLLGMDHTSVLAARTRYEKRDMGMLLP